MSHIGIIYSINSIINIIVLKETFLNRDKYMKYPNYESIIIQKHKMLIQFQETTQDILVNSTLDSPSNDKVEEFVGNSISHSP